MTVPCTEGFTPSGPWRITAGKKHIGEFLELMMFRNYNTLDWQLERIKLDYKGGTKTSYHAHLEWLLDRGEDREVETLCPQCGKNPIKWISVRGDKHGYSMHFGYTCCGERECKAKIFDLSLGKETAMLPVKFSSIKRFHCLSDQDQFVRLLRQIFQLPLKLESRKAFAFFSE